MGIRALTGQLATFGICISCRRSSRLYALLCRWSTHIGMASSCSNCVFEEVAPVPESDLARDQLPGSAFLVAGHVGHDEEMTVVKINAITVPAESGDELAYRFAARAGAVDNADGFEGFELLKPTDGRVQWLVVTRWRDEESFQAWLNSDSFAHGHRSAAERRGQGAPTPIATHSEVWSYVRAGGGSTG